MYTIKFTEDISKYTHIVYLLKQKGEVVYVGETAVGMRRAMHHFPEKIFDEIVLIQASAGKIARKREERMHILKYNPKYNKSDVLLAVQEDMYTKGYLDHKTLHRMIRDELGDAGYKYTNGLSRSMQRAPSFFVDEKIHIGFVSLEDADEITEYQLGGLSSIKPIDGVIPKGGRIGA